MTSQLVALIAIGIAFRGSYLHKKATNETQITSAKLVTLLALVLTILAFVLRSYNV
jgi:hypothetical protein